MQAKPEKKPEADAARDLADIYPAPTKPIMVNGIAVTATPLTLRKIGEIASIFERIAEGGSVELNWPQLLAKHTPDMAQVLEIATGCPGEAILDAPIDESARLAVAVFEVNHDFFVHRLGPLLTKVVARIGAMPTFGPGPTASRSSTGQASPTPAH